MKKIVKYEGIQKHGNCYIWKELLNVDVTCPECTTSSTKFKVHLNMGNTFTLVCHHCKCVFTIKIIEEEE